MLVSEPVRLHKTHQTLASDVFRAVHKFVWIGETEGMTPAMRLGFAKTPLALEYILWPGQRIPRPKRSRRKRLALAV